MADRDHGQIVCPLTCRQAQKGDVDPTLNELVDVAAHVDTGKVRVLAIADDKRHPALLDTPTGAELGYPEFLVRSTIGILGPSGMPSEVTGRLSAELGRIANDAGFQKRLESLGITPDPLDGRAYAKRIADERGRWSNLAKRVNIQVDK